MKLLILGESGSMGTGLPDPEVAWGRALQRGLAERDGVTPEVVHVRLYTWTAGWEDYLERAIAKGPFDVVILSPTKFAFSVYSADNRVRQVFGQRVGDWFKRSADAFDAQTRVQDDEGLRRKANRVAHRSVRKVVGQAPISTVEVITGTYLKAMARLAQLEDAQVIVLGNTNPSERMLERHPEVHARTVQFRNAMKAEAARRRFDWLERDGMWREEDGDRESVMFSDGLHKTAQIHSRMAASLLELIPPVPAGLPEMPAQ